MPRVAITGLGTISALGIGVPAFWDGLLAARSGVRRITLFDPTSLSIGIAAEVPAFDPLSAFTDTQLELLDRFSQLAIVAAREARKDAGLELDDETRERAGVALGTGMGGSMTTDRAYADVYLKGTQRVHPFTIPRMMPNAAAAQVTMSLGLQGPTLCFATACAASAHAIGEAAEIIRTGRADVMLAGGSDAPITLGVLRAWEAMRVLARPVNGDVSSACRPFSHDRQGLVLGEGAGVVVLEEWERARRRGAKIYAELAGYAATADAGHITQPGVDAPARAAQLALARASVAPADVDYVNAHGTGTLLNDATETTILKRVFGEHAPRLAISSTKAVHGHAMAASAALELVATVLAVEHGIAPPTANYTEPDPACDLDYVPNVARERTIRAAVSNSFAFGGLNAVLVVTKPST
jgi:nodulation protein E